MTDIVSAKQFLSSQFRFTTKDESWGVREKDGQLSVRLPRARKFIPFDTSESVLSMSTGQLRERVRRFLIDGQDTYKDAGKDG